MYVTCLYIVGGKIVFNHLRNSISCFCPGLLFTRGIPIDFVIHALFAPECEYLGFRCYYTPSDPLGLQKTGIGAAQKRNRVFEELLINRPLSVDVELPYSTFISL